MTAFEMTKCFKWLTENSNRPLTKEEKELAHKAIDECRTVRQLASVALKIAKIK